MITISNAAVDLGFSDTKWAIQIAPSKIKTGELPSLYLRGRSADSSGLGGPQNVRAIEIDGETYLTGGPLVHILESLRVTSSDYSSQPAYRALTLSALADIVDFSDAETVGQLVLGLPVASFKNKNTRSALRDLFRGEQLLPTTGGHKQRKININSVLVVPQAFGALVAFQSQLSTDSPIPERLLILDIGNGTTDWILSIHGEPIIETGGSISKGFYDIKRSVNATLHQQGRVSSTLELVDRIFRGYSQMIDRTHVTFEDIVPLLEAPIRSLIADAFNAIGHLNARDILLTGGTSTIVKPILEAAVPGITVHQASPDGKFDNVNGFLIYSILHGATHGK
jgi:PRTRC genetic system protein D